MLPQSFQWLLWLKYYSRGTGVEKVEGGMDTEEDVQKGYRSLLQKIPIPAFPTWKQMKKKNEMVQRKESLIIMQPLCVLYAAFSGGDLSDSV